MKLGFIGLGKMGSRMVIKLLKEGQDVVVWNRSSDAVGKLAQEYEKQIKKSTKKIGQLLVGATIKQFVEMLESPRVIWIMVPAGDAIQTVLDEISQFVQTKDIIIDGGNSFYKDTQKRSEQFEEKGVKFLGIGLSGGIIAADTGYPMMVGGDRVAYENIIPLLNCLSKPNGGYEYFGEGGAGHFVKMIHNGIEYGVMQSLAEGFEVLEKSPYKFDLLKIAKLYQKGTLLSGFMLDRVVDVLGKDSQLTDISGVIASSGEAEWTVNQAKEEKVEIEIIEKSLDFRKRSQTNEKIQNSFSAKLVAALRHAFGGHEMKKYND